MTAKPSQRGNDDSEVLKFKDLLYQIPKLSRPYSIFKDFPGPRKTETFFKDFQELSRPCGHPVQSSSRNCSSKPTGTHSTHTQRDGQAKLA